MICTPRRRTRVSFAAATAAALSLVLPLASPFLARAAADDKDKKDTKQTKPAAPAKKPGEDPEVKMGREAHEEMMRSGLKVVQDPKLVARVQNIAKKMVPIANTTKLDALYGSSELVPYDYKFFIVDDSDINAFSLPGGYIYINKGLLNYVQSDDELAGVIGHEIMHAGHHHVIKLQKEQSKLTNQMALGMLFTFLARVPTTDAYNLMQGFQLIALQKVNGFGQTAEKDADRAGLVISSKAGYNPVGMLTFMERLGRDQRMRPDMELGIFRTHPPEKERAEAITGQIREMGIPIRRREVTNSLKVQTRAITVKETASATATDAPKQGSEVVLDGTVLFRTPDANKAKKAAETLDRLLDQDIQLYDVTKRGSDILVRGETVVSISPEDLTLPGSYPSVQVAADACYKNLRNMLYKEFLINAN
jgi:predicted Zn-dependent protease